MNIPLLFSWNITIMKKSRKISPKKCHGAAKPFKLRANKFRENPDGRDRGAAEAGVHPLFPGQVQAVFPHTSADTKLLCSPEPDT
jgi:hypothetical protein